MSRRKRWTRRRRRPRGIPCDDPGRHERLRWRREAGELIAALEPGNDDQEKLRRLLISLADFLEPGRRQHLGAEGVWGVFQAFREIAEEGAPDSCRRLQFRRLAGPGSGPMTPPIHEP